MTRFLTTLTVALGAACCMLAGPALSQSVWLAPQPRLGPNSDYMSLFEPNAPWRQVASKVKVFAVGGEFVFTAPDDVLRRIFSDVARRGLTLQVGILPLTAPDGHGPESCAYGVEGYGGPPMLKFAQRLKSLGAQPKFFTMDEPLYFGHVYHEGRRGCRTSIAELARDVADKFKAMRQVFPDARFGEVEPITFNPNDPWYKGDRWLHDLSEWYDAYEAATGDKMAYLRLDLWWRMPWQQHMPALARLLHTKGIPYQVIYNAEGNPAPRTDAAWTGSAASNFKAFESGAWPKPDAAVFNYWTQPPMRVLPENDPTTITGLVAQYIRWREAQGRPVSAPASSH